MFRVVRKESLNTYSQIGVKLALKNLISKTSIDRVSIKLAVELQASIAF